MDPMRMEAALCSPIAVASISTGQVGLSTMNGVNFSSQVVPLTYGEVCARGKAVVGGVDPPVGSSLPTSSIRGSTFADLFKAAPILGDYVSGPSILSKKGGYVAVRMDPSAYKSRLEACKCSLIGQIPDFNPALQKSSNAQVWIRFYDLSWEYWHPKIVSDLARRIGVPLPLDGATVEGDFRHFASVMVDIDVSNVPPSSLLLERDDSHSSFISVEYENLPAFCSTCSSIGHLPNACRWNKSSKVILVNSSKPDSARDGPTTIVVDEGFQIPRNCASKLVYHPISGSQKEVSVSNVFTAIQQDLGSLDSIVVHYSTGSDPVLSMGSSTSVIASPSLTFSMGPTISVVAAQVGQPQEGGRNDDSLNDVLLASSDSVVSAILSDSTSLTISHDQQSWEC
ncbi:hypothetical protein Ddye_010117 [Dipteronia dyeriana]|uniref:DUF4283 domain-containing protein n=1 Tax=Dipteronia dyeriana TaxID=168575 RepID=A0AAD9XCX3_9ROSI|nr:hypothetical protein Ddye_010117 [Dipteronia dyeriana]